MKVNRLADGVFSRIVGNSREISSYDRFMNLESEITSSEGVSKHLSPYKELVNKNKSIFQKLAQYEDLIMLYRIRENLDIQLSTQREMSMRDKVVLDLIPGIKTSVSVSPRPNSTM